jgi:hypothetical protein
MIDPYYASISDLQRMKMLRSNRAGRILLLMAALATIGMFADVAVAQDQSRKAQLQIEADDWGFDGRVVPRKFNLLTLAVRNISNETFNGVINLRRQQAIDGGATMAEAVTIGPQGKRIVQFYPYIGENVDVFEVSWGRTLHDRHTVEQAAVSAGARVMINDPRRASGFQVSLHSFREDRFPSTVIGTDSLRIAVLDHSPRWQARQKEAFRDWLFKGGHLHVIQGVDGNFPEIPVPELSTTQLSSFGAGRVFWHSMGRDGVNRQFVNNVIFNERPAVELVSLQGHSVDTDPTIPNTRRSFSVKNDWIAASEITRLMKDLVPYKHNWGLIFILSFIYVALVFPGGLILARKITDYRVNLLALIGLVTATSFLFSNIGARGYGEKGTTNVLATATPLPDGYWSTEQLHSVFVTEGAQYTLEQKAESTTFSAAQSRDSPKGFIDSGRNAKFNVDIPPFTFRSFAAHSRVKMSPVSFSVKSSKFIRNRLSVLELNQVGALPSKPISGVVLYNDQAYEVNLSSLKSGRNIVATQNREIRRYQFQNRTRSYRGKSQSRALGEFRIRMIAYELGLFRQEDARSYRHTKDRVCLFIYAELPNELHTINAETGQPMGKQDGRVLYRFELELPVQ